MVTTFEELLEKKTIFVDKTVLSPHYVPESMLFREKQLEEIMKTLTPALKGQKPRNIFLYGKTGTGKTSSIKYVLNHFNRQSQKSGSKTEMVYLNCSIYDSRYKILQKLMRPHYPELEKSGFGISYIYEKLVEKLGEDNHIIAVLDEMDMIKELSDLIYTFTRCNDEVKVGGLTLVGISNKLSFKNELDPRARSSLYENEVIFPPYDASQLKNILMQRIELGFQKESVSDAALSLISAITAQENGDARYSLKLLLKAGDVAESMGAMKIEENHVEEAKNLVEYDFASEGISRLPINHQIVLYTIAKMSIANKQKLTEGEDSYLFSGDVYDQYTKMARKVSKTPKSARWYREYINELEAMGLISTVFTSKGIRGHTRLIRIGHNPNDIIQIIEKNIGMRS
ncbi:MAG: AAA family ATPase [Candidatus Micrarchaeota archaeon]|nr:AAA family ATPase [Candidatus Micrarchaeota archaeon]